MFGTIIVINKAWRDHPGTVASAIGHVSLSIADQVAQGSVLERVDYRDADGSLYPAMSVAPVLVMTGQLSKLWTLWDALHQKSLPRAAYLDTMISGGSEAQMEATRLAKRADITPIAIATYCDRAEIADTTKRFSLYK